jgi:hypothetical protein
MGLSAVGFDVVETKQSPKVAFFACRKLKLDGWEEKTVDDSRFDKFWLRTNQLHGDNRLDCVDSEAPTSDDTHDSFESDSAATTDESVRAIALDQPPPVVINSEDQRFADFIANCIPSTKRAFSHPAPVARRGKGRNDFSITFW